MTTTSTRRDAMPDSVMLTKPHHMTYTLTLLLLLMLLASTHSRHDDRNSLLANVDTESSDDELAARDQARVSDTHTAAAAAAACWTPSLSMSLYTVISPPFHLFTTCIMPTSYHKEMTLIIIITIIIIIIIVICS